MDERENCYKTYLNYIVMNFNIIQASEPFLLLEIEADLEIEQEKHKIIDVVSDINIYSSNLKEIILRIKYLSFEFYLKVPERFNELNESINIFDNIIKKIYKIYEEL